MPEAALEPDPPCEPESSTFLSEPEIVTGFFSDRVKTVQAAYDEWYRGFRGKPAALAAYNGTKNTHGSMIDKKDVKKRYSRGWLPEAMHAAIRAGVDESTLVKSTDEVVREFDWSLPRLREAFRLLKMEAGNERDVTNKRYDHWGNFATDEAA